jgi:hypothetical protein
VLSTLENKLPQEKEKDYSALFISMMAHLILINLNINCHYAIKISEAIK